MKKIVIFSLWIFLLVGCASGPIGRLPNIEDNNQVGNVFVIRNKSIAANTISYYITLNDNEIFAISVGQYTKLRIASAEHNIGVKCFGGLTPTWKEDSIKFTLLAQQDAYFIVSPSISPCADIQSINPESGKEWINKSEYVRMPE